MNLDRYSFHDSTEIAIDVQGRVSIPVDQRAILNPFREDVPLMASVERSGCIFLRLESDWHATVAALRQGAQSHELTDRLLRVTAHSVRTKCDSKGRVQLPAKLLKKIELDPKQTDRVHFSGALDALCIWKPAAWEAFDSVTEA